MFMVKSSPTALNFGYDFVLLVHFLGHPVYEINAILCVCLSLYVVIVHKKCTNVAVTVSGPAVESSKPAESEKCEGALLDRDRVKAKLCLYFRQSERRPGLGSADAAPA